MIDCWIEEYETPDGYREVGGRPHGFAWKPRWLVNVRCESEDEARRIKAAVQGFAAAEKSIQRLIKEAEE